LWLWDARAMDIIDKTWRRPTQGFPFFVWEIKAFSHQKIPNVVGKTLLYFSFTRTNKFLAIDGGPSIHNTIARVFSTNARGRMCLFK
jgi:hypothetical protein